MNEPTATDLDGVMGAARDYIDGYTHGDTGRLTDATSGVTELPIPSPQIMADYAATG